MIDNYGTAQRLREKDEKMNKIYVDTTFDVRTDSNGRDPDNSSNTLKQYHKFLWSKELPTGKLFELDDTIKNAYLYYKSELGEFFLASDSIIHTYFKWKRTQHIIIQISKEEMAEFYKLAHTVGGYIIFPGNRVDGQNTMNQARGMSRAINDRIDLTLECIRRYYIHEASPLADTITRYSDFFDLFLDFKGYCEFFLLQDLVTSDFANIKYFLPFTDFSAGQVPKTVDEYRTYMQNNVEFITSRNRRVSTYNNALIG
jgi:hypothetical protein